jgi:murein DD-endopeptidase MepM/ murein hydrolase activator NlpD
MNVRPIPITVLLLVAALSCHAQSSTDQPIGLEVEVRARVVAPGEPLRVVVASPVALQSLSGRFLDETIFFVRRPAGDDGREVWSGWAMVGLDHEPGLAVIELSGALPDGTTAAATHAVEIEPKRFPEEQLSVAPKYVEPPEDVRKRLAAERARLAEIYRERSPAPVAGAFVRPVPGEPTSVFGTRRLYNGKPRSPHPGLDLRASTGTPVASSGPGRIVLAQDLYYSGNTVIVDHGGGLFTLYAHLSELGVAEGQTVEPGQTLGLSGATGRVTGPHLHWGAKIGDRPFDPTALLDSRLFDH